MKTIDRLFAQLLFDIFVYGDKVTTRNAEVIRKTNMMVTFDSTPLIGVRRTAWKNALREMEWMLSGSSNINDLHENVHSWWKPWVDKDGEIKNNYGSQFRNFYGESGIPVDQIENSINLLIDDPMSRRNIITTWNSADMVDPETPITNCHNSHTQLFVDSKGKVHMSMIQRSADMVLGVPHNLIAQWAMLIWLSYKCNREVGSLTWIAMDAHIYNDHIKMVDKIIKYDKLDELQTPQLVYTPTSEDFKASDFTLDSDYEPVFKESLKMTV